MRNIDDGEDFQDFSPTRRIYIPRRRTMPDLRDLLSEKLTDFERSVLAQGGKLSYEETAERLGTNSKAVDNALQRIRRKLASDSRR